MRASAIVGVRAFGVRRDESGRWLRRRAVATLVGVALVTAIVPTHQVARAAATLVVDADGQGTAVDCDAVGAVASSTIAAAVASATGGDTVHVCPGTYNENVVVDKRITLEGSGSGSDATAGTIIASATASTDVIRLTAGGSSSTDRMVIRDLRVTGATGDGNGANGIEIAGGSGYTTFDDVAVVNNDGNGIAINTSGGDFNDLEILNSTIDGNGGTGVRIPSSIGSLDGLVIDNTTISNSAVAGLATNPSASSASITNLTVSNTTFTGNNAGNDPNKQSISLFGFRGNVTLQDVNVEHSNVGHAIQIDGRNQSGAPGIMELDGLTVTGSPGKTAILVQSFGSEDLSASLRFTDVDLREAEPAWAQIAISHSAAAVNLGNTRFTAGGGAAAIDMWSSGGADATGAQFFDSSGAPVFDGFAIEDSISHALDDPGLGKVTFEAGQVYARPTVGVVQRGIDIADPGDTVNVGSGTYAGDLLIAEGITLHGAGDDEGSGTIISVPGDVDAIAVTADGVTLEGLRVAKGDGEGGDDGTGVEVTADVDDLALTDVTITGATSGFRVGSGVTVNGLVVSDSHFDGNRFGWYLAKETADSGDATVTGVRVTNTTFSDNARKGIYAEKLDDAVFDGITVADSGTDPTYPVNNGIDINLKWSAYADIEIRNSTVIGSGLEGSGQPFDPAGITIKARDDGVYAVPAATLTGVTLDNVTVSGGVVGVRFGEEGKDNAGPTNVTVRASTLSGTGGVALANETQATVDAACNWWGSAAGPAEGAVSGLVDVATWLLAEDDSCPDDGDDSDPVPPSPPPPPPPPATTVEAEPGETVEVATDEVVTAVTAPTGGTVTVAVSEEVTEEPVAGLSFLDFQVEIDAPEATPEEPLALDLRVAEPAVPEGTDATRLVVLRNGVPVPGCTGPDGVAQPDPCVSRRSNDGGVGFTVLTSRASVWTVAVVEDACVEGLVPDPGFADVAGNAHESAIACLAWWDVSQGTSATTFAPGVRLTRAQTASLLARTLAEVGVELPSDPADAFTDDERSIHELAINQLAALGVIAGLGDGAFGPDVPGTRGQLATLTVRVYELTAGTALPAGDDRFTDDDGDVHEANIDKAAAAGFTHGTSATTFDPLGAVSRDQAASLLTRVLDQLVTDRLATPPL